MKKDSQLWNKILAAVLRMPGVRVDRVDFLTKALAPYCNEQKLSLLPNVRPYAIATDKAISNAATACINYHTALATTGSTVAGLPGGLAMMATIPGDITQYYYHVVVLSQKLAYLYGFPDFFAEAEADEEGGAELSDVSSDLLTIFVGSMMGVRVADQGLGELAKGVATQTVSRLPRMVITKLALYPVAKQVARLVGVKLSKEGFAKTVGRFIPIAGGIFSGTLTLFTFRPGALRLQRRLKAQKRFFAATDVDALEYDQIRASLVKAEQVEANPQACRVAMMQAMVNMANISDSISPEMQDFVEERIAEADLPDKEQLTLLETLGTEYSIDVDYDVLACDPVTAHDTIVLLLDVMRVAGRFSVAEKMYLTMTAKTLGLSKEELNELQEQA